MVGWFSRKHDKAKPLMPEGKWLVECDGDALRATDDKQTAKQVAKSALTGVIIETNDSGPWGEDVWWLLFGPDDQVAVAYPQGATGEDAMLSYLMSLPGFDHAKMTEAMGSTNNSVFPVWRRPR
jgi:hypothetical protein